MGIRTRPMSCKTATCISYQSAARQVPGRSRWLGWSGGTPGGTPSAGGAAPSAGSAAVALRLLRDGKDQLLLLALTQAGLECWQVRAWPAMTAGLAGTLANSLACIAWPTSRASGPCCCCLNATHGLACSPVPSLYNWPHMASCAFGLHCGIVYPILSVPTVILCDGPCPHANAKLACRAGPACGMAYEVLSVMPCR